MCGQIKYQLHAIATRLETRFQLIVLFLPPERPRPPTATNSESRTLTALQNFGDPYSKNNGGEDMGNPDAEDTSSRAIPGTGARL